MLLFVYTTTRKGFVIFTYWAWAACVEWSRNTDGIKFSKILLSIILFPQLRIHKRGCPVSPPRWLCLSDRWKPKCLSVWSCIRDLVFCPYGKQSETVLFFLSASFTGHPQSLMNYICYIHLELGTDTKSWFQGQWLSRMNHEPLSISCYGSCIHLSLNVVVAVVAVLSFQKPKLRDSPKQGR